MAKRKTNVQMITHLMKFSRCGALQQAFILEAIQRYAKQCIEAGPAAFESGLMSGQAWVSCAVEARDTINAHLSS